VKKQGIIYPVAIYGPPRPTAKVQQLPIKDDALRKALATIEQLRRDMSRQEDRQRRIREEIMTEIKIWIELLETGKPLSYEYIKRRISGLKGSLEYPGIVGNLNHSS
jgi:hypothetical protein